MKTTSPAAHGAVVSVAALAGVFATTPGQTVGVSSFIDPIAADLGLAREHVLVLYSAGTFLGILGAPLVGRLVDRFGPRRLILPIVVALALACAVMSAAQDAWSLGIGFLILRAAAIAGLSLVTMQMVNLWFDRFRGRVTALAMMGLALGGLVLPLLVEPIVQGEGWRAAYLALAAGVLAVMLPVGLILYRDRPAGPRDGHDFGRVSEGQAPGLSAGLTLGESARTSMFWYLVVITVLVNGVGTALMLDHMRAMGQAGLGRVDALLLLGAMTTAQALSTLASGFLVDRFGACPIGLLGLGALAFAVSCVMLVPHLGGGLPYAVALGAMIGTLQLVHSAGLGEAFGTLHLGSIRGTTFVAGVSGAAAGPLPFLWSADVAYVVFLALTAVAIALGLASLRTARSIPQ